MVDNFMSAGTNGDADDELPAPYGTGPKNRTTEEHHRSDYGYADDSGDSWRDRSTLEGLDPSPSLPNAPRTYERGPVPQQPYVPKPPFLPAEERSYPSQYADPQRQYDDRRPAQYDPRENGRGLPPESPREAGRENGRDNGRGFPPEPGRDAARDAGRDLGREPARLLPPDAGREPGRPLPPEPGRLLPPEGREAARDLGRDPARDNTRELAQEAARYDDSPFAPSAYQERPPAPPQPGRQQSPFAPQQGEPPRRAPEPPANRQAPPPQQGTPPQRPAGPPPGNGSNGLTQHSNGTPGNGWSGSAPTPPPPPPSNGLTNRPSANTPPPAPSNGSANGNGQPAPNPLGSSNGTGLGTSNGLGSGTGNGLGSGTGNGNGTGSNGLGNGSTLSNSNGHSNSNGLSNGGNGHTGAPGNGYPAPQSTGIQPAIQASTPTPPPPGAQQRPPANRPPTQPPAAQQNAAVNGYPTDPSAEYESNHPETRPEQPRAEGRPEMRTEGRPVGARRRADVQQDAPSQVKAEAASSHRARRAQPGSDAPAAQQGHAGGNAPGTQQGHAAGNAPGAQHGQPGTPGQPSAQAQPGSHAQPGTPGQPGTPAQARPTGQQAANVTNTMPSDPSHSGVLNAPGATGTPADGSKRPRKYRIHHLRDMKNRGEKWAMLTAYDQYTAEIFDDAGIPVLLVGDSAANNVYGYESTLRVTVDELIPLARAVATATQRALVVADLPFGSYQGSPEQAFHTAVRFMKEAGVAAVKLEGGRTVVPAVEKLTQAGIPVMAHIGFTPQSEHAIGGYRVQGRGDQAAGLIDDAVALAEAGAFSVVLEMVPGDVAAEITKRISIPTIGIGAGRDTDAQVLVWQDMAGLRSGPMPRFVKQYADLRTILTTAATTYAAEVSNGSFPADEHTF